MILPYKEFINEQISGQLFNPPPKKFIKFNLKDHPELKDELFDLINLAYSEIGGYAKIQKSEDLLNSEWDYWEGADLHNSKDFDIVIFGQKTKYGIKYSGVGHDGSKESKKFYINSRIEHLKELGYYVEVSGKIAEILINNGVPIIKDKNIVEKVLGKEVEWVEDGWYIRKIGGVEHKKILMGKPKIN